jgi:hypothetical protein
MTLLRAMENMMVIDKQIHVGFLNDDKSNGYAVVVLVRFATVFDFIVKAKKR